VHKHLSWRHWTLGQPCCNSVCREGQKLGVQEQVVGWTDEPRLESKSGKTAESNKQRNQYLWAKDWVLQKVTIYFIFPSDIRILKNLPQNHF